MSPCLVFTLPAGANYQLSDTAFDASGLFAKALASFSSAQQQKPETWLGPLEQLAATPLVTQGTTQELHQFQTIVRQQIEASLTAIQQEHAWRESGLPEKLAKALSLVQAGRTTAGYQKAVELIGFASLASTACLTTPGVSSDSGAACSTMSSSSTAAPQFKVPALPAKRSRQQLEQQQRPEQQRQISQLRQSNAAGQQHPQQQQRKHSAPKRRATPQVLPGGPFSITPAAPPASQTHGETCCDEQLLSYWCPISDKRQHASDILPAGSDTQATSSSAASSSAASSTVTAQHQAPLAAASPQQQAPAAAAASRSSGTSSSVSSLSGVSSVPAAAALPPKAPSHSNRSAASAARAASHAEAAEALKRLIHEDPALSKPAADVLLFNKAAQQPIQSWTGTIKHKHAGRVVELCTLTLQVPEPFLEEFPATLYAADVRHRRAVSLGRHVVCRATLGTLSEHQLAGLATMARGQLVALCSLQTAELHLVPYFDNKNLVRMVGFLKIKAD